MPLDLLIPDLLLPREAPPALRALRLPALEKWLARSRVERAGGRDAAAWLASAFALPAPPPVAAISLAGEGAARDGSWLRADPVHLRIDHDYLKLHDASGLDVTRDEAEALVAALQSHFRGDGFELHAAAPDRWYLRVPEGKLPKTTPLQDALGKDVLGLLPEGWTAALTEAQMLLAGHEVNAKREAAGKPAINSVWFWGEGSAPSRVGKPYALVHADDVFARGLAKLSGAEARPLAATLAEVDLVREGDRALVVIDRLTAPLHRGDEGAWRSAAEALDASWFANLGEAIGRFGEVRLVLPAREDTRVASLDSASRWRWFRARKPLAAHA
jgi:hypothetical protein